MVFDLKGHPVGNLEPRIVGAVPLNKPRLVARAVHHQLRHNLVAPPGGDDRVLLPVLHTGSIHGVPHDAGPGPLQLVAAHLLQAQAVHPSIAAVESQALVPGPAVGAPQEQVGVLPLVLQAVLHLLGVAQPLPEGLPFILPYSIVVRPCTFWLRINERNPSIVAISQKRCQDSPRRPSSNNRHIHCKWSSLGIIRTWFRFTGKNRLQAKI
mmetsp:Transcript_15519/g.22836  ORF Transcript_15519/g.22836 Transcript_15519/m.22836 type:complete len:210 (-) Transcript_15519:266-895(-)